MAVFALLFLLGSPALSVPIAFSFSPWPSSWLYKAEQPIQSYNSAKLYLLRVGKLAKKYLETGKRLSFYQGLTRGYVCSPWPKYF